MKNQTQDSAKCIIYNTVLDTEISSINRHLNSKKHKLMSNSVSTTSSLSDSFKPKNISLLEKVKSAEIKLTAFVAEHNISFNTMDHLTELGN